MAQIDLRRADIRIFDGTPGTPNYIDVKIGEGEFTYSEKRQIDYVKSRGELDTFRENEEVPVDITLVAIWEFITSDSGDPVTIEDALKRRNGAASWASASSDPYAPYCVNIAITYTPPCSGVKKEVIAFPMFSWIELAHDLAQGQIAIKGSANCTSASVSRVS